MAYDTANPPLIISEPLGSGPTVWQYTSTDGAATIAASGYFSNGAYLGMAAGDVLFAVNGTTGAVITTSLLSPTTAGITSPTVSNTAVLVSQSYAGWTRSSNGVSGDNVFQTLTTVTLPGGTMGLNSKLLVIPDWDYISSTNNKIMGLNFGATEVSAVPIAALNYVVGKFPIEIQNINSLSIQKTANSSTYGLSANPRFSSTINTANDVTIAFKCQWGAAGVAGETITLLGYSIWHYPGS